MKRIVLSICVAIFPASLCHSDEILDLRLKADGWAATAQGRVQSADIVDADQTTAATRISLFSRGIEDEFQLGYSINFNHSLPLIPKIRFDYWSFNFEGEENATSDINYVDSTYTTGTPLRTEFELTATDLTAYYTIIDGWIQLDTGLTLLKTDGSLTLTDTTPATDDGGGTPTTPTSSEASVDSQVIALDGVLRYQLPESSMQFGLNVNYNNSGTKHYSTFESLIEYSHSASPFDFSLEIGYRKRKFIDESWGDLSSSIEIAGPFANLTILM